MNDLAEGVSGMKTLKYSRQRESIKNCLMNRTDHPTADTLYLTVREEFPNISLGTVYRNLNLLAELGEITRFSCGDGSEHFDFRTEPHYHFCVQVLRRHPGSSRGNGAGYL